MTGMGRCVCHRQDHPIGDTTIVSLPSIDSTPRGAELIVMYILVNGKIVIMCVWRSTISQWELIGMNDDEV
jgi:hypothetical protein